MAQVVKYCEKCFQDPYKYAEHMCSIADLDIQYMIEEGSIGYYITDANDEYCQYHNEEKLISSNLTVDEYNYLILEVNPRLDFIQAMDNLKQSDPIEFQLKMTQFKANLSQTQAAVEEERNKIRCPKCNSTQITTGARGVSHFWGFIGASKTVNRCAKCGHTWKP